MSASDDRNAALLTLMREIFELEQAGEWVPCVNPKRAHWWISEEADQQEAAAHGCLTNCPAFEACERYVDAHPEPAGVWAGRHKPTPRLLREAK